MYQYYGTELYHRGVQGRSGRYKWGSGARPYQRLEKPKRQNFFQKRKAARQEQKRLEAMNVSAKEAAEKVKRMQKKEEILNKGSASEVLKYKEEFGLTNQELQNALTRIKTTSELSSYAAKEYKSGWDAMNDAMKKVQYVNNWTTTGVNALKSIKTVMEFIDEASKSAENAKKKGSDGGDKQKTKGS